MCLGSIWLAHDENWALCVAYVGCEGGNGMLPVKEFLEQYPHHDSDVAELLNKLINVDIKKKLGN